MIKEMAGATETIVITRVFDAPRDRVFAAWTEPERMTQWWGPRGFTTPVCRIDLRPGGILHFAMRSPDGQDFWCKGVYREIIAPERIVATDSFSDEAGNLVLPTHYGMSADWPAEALRTVTFAERGGQTAFTLHHAVGSAGAAEREMCAAGWSENVNNLLPFYRDVLGLPVGLEIPGFVVLGTLGTPALALGTHSEVHGRNTDPARHMVGLGTDDVTGDWKRLTDAGVEFVENPTDYGTLRIATLKDPEGNLIQLLQPLAAFVAYGRWRLAPQQARSRA